ncbi:MAG: flagellar filament outer layer protein FlaA [Spirochaetaceae bacterium]|nr:flagellar filament outer layer protein FlaA [Spirochaetaceae bacterium]
MKKGGVLIASLFFFACLSVLPVFADGSTVSLEAVVIEAFDGDSDYDWRTDGIKDALKKDSRLFPVSPDALFRTTEQKEGKQSLGLNGQFRRQGYNWIDIYPVSKENPDAPTEIPMTGDVRFIDVWAWGSNLDYRLEVYIRDYRGMIHRVEMGSLAFLGWKNLTAPVPVNFPMSDRALPINKVSSKFVKFRLWTGPDERVNNFYLYLDQLKVLTDTFKTRFDGDELADFDYEQELWAEVNQQ